MAEQNENDTGALKAGEEEAISRRDFVTGAAAAVGTAAMFDAGRAAAQPAGRISPS